MRARVWTFLYLLRLRLPIWLFYATRPNLSTVVDRAHLVGRAVIRTRGRISDGLYRGQLDCGLPDRLRG